jgi:hypothetical protein
MKPTKQEFEQIEDCKALADHSLSGRGYAVQESEIHSFIVKVWLEETVEEAGRAKWRGHITHVRSGERRYLQRLSGIGDFIMPYLERMGVRAGILRRLRQLLLNR